MTPTEEARATVAAALDDLREVALHPRRYNVALEWVEREKALDAAISALVATTTARTEFRCREMLPDLEPLECARAAVSAYDEEFAAKGCWSVDADGKSAHSRCFIACVALARNILAKIPPW